MFPTLRVSGGVIVIAKAADPEVDTSLTAGDVIHAINGVPVETMEALRTTLDHMKPNSAAVLQIEREGKLMFVFFQLD
jgi:serine protease Do